MGILLDKLAGLDAKLLLKAGGKILRVLESHLVGQVADTNVGLRLGQSYGFLHAYVANEGRHVETCQGTKLVVQCGGRGTHLQGKAVAVEVAVGQVLDDALGSPSQDSKYVSVSITVNDTIF